MLNSKGEVADFLNVNQFIPGRSAYECVAYSAALIKYCGQPGHGPTGTVQEASNLAQYYYGLEEGGNSAANTNGMSLLAEYDMLHRMGLTYQQLSPMVAAVKNALTAIGPVMLCGAETGMYDVDLGDRIPYSWTPSGNHCIVVSGVASDGNLLVHDCASIAPSGVRPGPRRYDQAKLQIVSATAIHVPWIGGTSMNVPSGWRWDVNTHTLFCPNNALGQPEVPIVEPFASYIMSNAWSNGNVALAPVYHTNCLEEQSPADEFGGSGKQLICRYAMLCVADSGKYAGKIIFEWLGVTLAHVRSQFAQSKFDLAAEKSKSAGLTTQLAQATAQVAQEQQELASLKQELAGKPDINTFANRMQSIVLALKPAADSIAQAEQLATQPIQ